ncbi:MAG: PIN domain-containing protein [Cyanobacteriota bacterium]
MEQAPACGLKAADALHLAIAHRHRLTLISADQALIQAAKALKVPAQPLDDF